MQCAYNVTMWRVRVATVAMETQRVPSILMTYTYRCPQYKYCTWSHRNTTQQCITQCHTIHTHASM